LVEEEATIDAISDVAKAAILKTVGAGKLRAVETLSKPGQTMMYDAEVTSSAGNKPEMMVKADGTETKED
jgi:hypothetical protein